MTDTPEPEGTATPAPFTIVGADDAAVCVDGVCAVPSPVREAEAGSAEPDEAADEATGPTYSLVTDVKES